MGKGSAPRKFSVDHHTFSSNWDAIFGKKSNARNQPRESDQVHSGECSTFRPSEGQQSVHRKLSQDGEKPSDE